VSAAKRRASSGPATPKTWLIRGLIAITAGLVIGAAGGVAGVNMLEPGRPGQPDSLQVMLDSLQRAKNQESPMSLRRAADSADAARRAQRVADSVALANDPNAPMVPMVVGLEEGAARTAIEDAGLTVGSVIFRADSAIAGTVLASTPAAGRKVRPGTSVDIVLSDGRTVGPDTSVAPPDFTGAGTSGEPIAAPDLHTRTIR